MAESLSNRRRSLQSTDPLNQTALTLSSGPLRIAAFTFSYFPMMTGISSLVHERIACLLRRGHTVRLFHPQVPEGDESQASGCAGLEELRTAGDFSSVTFPTVRNPLRRSFPEAASHRVWDDSRLLADFSPQIITVDEAAGLYGAASGWLRGYGKPVGVRYAKQHRVPCVNLLQTDWQGYCEHYTGVMPFRLFVPMVRRIMKPVTTGYDANLSPSSYLMERNLPIYGEQVKHLGFHGVDCERFCPENVRFNPVAGDSSPIILSTGRIAREKNVWQLLEAFRLVQSQVPDARLVILGRGPLLQKLQSRAKSLGDRVHIPGAVFGETLKGWYAQASVYWTASRTENFSASVLESLASGTPVVATAAGGNVEQIIDGTCGHLVPVNATSQMAERTIEILKNPSRQQAMSMAARQRALELSLENATERLVEFLRNLIDSSAATRH